MAKNTSDLMAMKVAELKQMCKEGGIRHYNGKNCFKKIELVEAILRAEENVEDNKQSAKDETKNDNHDAEAVSNKKHTAAIIDMEQKMPYIEKAEVGALVAFRLSSGKVKSAKVINKSSKNRKLKLETEYGAIYVVSYDDVIWVRTGLRWPTGVYKLLKGLGGENVVKEQKVEA